MCIYPGSPLKVEAGVHRDLLGTLFFLSQARPSSMTRLCLEMKSVRPLLAPQRDEWHSSLLFLPPHSPTERVQLLSLLQEKRLLQEPRTAPVLKSEIFLSLFFFPPLIFSTLHPPSPPCATPSASEETTRGGDLGCGLTDRRTATEVQWRIYDHHIFCSPSSPPPSTEPPVS